MIVSARGLCRTYVTPRGPIAAVEAIDLDVECGDLLRSVDDRARASRPCSE